MLHDSPIALVVLLKHKKATGSSLKYRYASEQLNSEYFNEKRSTGLSPYFAKAASLFLDCTLHLTLIYGKVVYLQMILGENAGKVPP